MWWLQPLYGSIMLEKFYYYFFLYFSFFNQVTSIFHLRGGKIKRKVFFLDYLGYMVQGPDCGVALIISIMTLGGWNAPDAFWTFCSNMCPRTICALYNNMCSSTQAASHRNRQLYGFANQCTHRGLLF